MRDRQTSLTIANYGALRATGIDYGGRGDRGRRMRHADGDAPWGAYEVNTVLGTTAGDALISGVSLATLVGGAGNDSFVINNVNDLVMERPNQGRDTVLSSVSCVLSDNVENLTLTGSADLMPANDAIYRRAA